MHEPAARPNDHEEKKQPKTTLDLLAEATETVVQEETKQQQQQQQQHYLKNITTTSSSRTEQEAGLAITNASSSAISAETSDVRNNNNNDGETTNDTTYTTNDDAAGENTNDNNKATTTHEPMEIEETTTQQQKQDDNSGGGDVVMEDAAADGSKDEEERNINKSAIDDENNKSAAVEAGASQADVAAVETTNAENSQKNNGGSEEIEQSKSEAATEHAESSPHSTSAVAEEEKKSEEKGSVSASRSESTATSPTASETAQIGSEVKQKADDTASSSKMVGDEPAAAKKEEAKATGASGERGTGSSSSSSSTTATEQKAQDSKKKDDGDNKKVKTEKSKKPSDDDNKAKANDSAAPPPPVMKGTLSYELDQRRHLIRGMWNYENSTVLPPQRFELHRNLGPDEDPKVLPQDGEFSGSFSLAYFHTTSKGKQKERSKVIPESGVKIKFTKMEGKEREYKVDGKGTNQFGIFLISGTATPSSVPGDPTLNVVLRKRYEPSSLTAAAPVDASTTTSKSESKDRGTMSDSNASEPLGGPLPPPSKSYASSVVCLRGKLSKVESNDLGITEVVHRISGMWAAGLDVLLGDPQNTRGLANRFEYEHKSSVPSNAFPVSGRYSGWFDLSNEDGSRTRINERDVTLKFRNNNAGYQNVEGRGSNVFGKYTISGTLTNDNVITIFRHFQPRKLKSKAATSAPAPVSAPGQSRRPSLTPAFEPKLKLSDVKVPPEAENGSHLEPLKPPAHTSYSAVSRGILRLNDDGSHSCQGKWAVTREHFTNGQTSNFNFRLEAHFAAEAAAKNKGKSDERKFPLDSEMYKGSFQLKKQGSRYQTIVDQQIVMKFRLNSQGAYNVYGKGVNAIGEFNLIGTMIMSGKTGGQVELFRMYPPERLTAPPAPKSTTTASSAGPTSKAGGIHRQSSAPLPGPPTQAPLQRRESTRTVKLPSKLEDDDPSALLSRTMNKCAQILRIIREKDVELGAFFSEPVDPVALGIPSYHQIVKEPMDLRTVHRRMEANSIPSPEEFARLVRLVFENAMTFNIDPAHSVHQAARSLLVLFNQKYRDVDRMVQNLRRATDEEKGKKKGKDEKKRKRQAEEPKSLKRRRLEEAQAMSLANENAVAAIVAAAPATNAAHVTRSEFNMLLHLIQQLQRQQVQSHTALAELSPGDEGDAGPVAAATSGPSVAPSAVPSAVPLPPAPAPERKKPAKRKTATPEPVVDDSRPLTLDEQEQLTETINELPQEHLHGVIQIIREAAPVGADEDEIDLEIDQLDTKTQRKLLRHVQKFVKKSKAKGAKKQKKTKKNEQASSTKKTSAASKPKSAATDSFFAFGSKGDSDSDSDDDAKKGGTTAQQTGGKNIASKEFKLSDGLGDLHDDDDHDLGSGGFAANWKMSKPTAGAEKKEGDDDDAWGAAREHAAAAKAREAERKAREEKMKEEAELAKNQRLADAAKRGEEIKAQRLEEEANEARLREQQEKEAEEARKAAREAARAQIQSVEQTVDLDAQRDIMKQYEQSFLDKDLGSASPSSDFGF